MQFGGYDTALLLEQNEKKDYGIHWYPLSGTAWWQINIEGIKYGSDLISNGKTRTCIMDTGTSLIAVPSYEFKKLVKAW